MSSPTRFLNGISTAESGPLKNLPIIDPTQYYVYFEDFSTYTAADFTVTETQAGATQALDDAFGGVLLLTNTAADDDVISLQKVGESFKFVAGKKTFFEAYFKCSEATQIDWLFGLVITDTTPLSHTDGVVFRKDDGDTNIDFASVKNSSGSTSDAIATFAASTYTKVGFYYDGLDFHLYVDGVRVAVVSAATIPDDEEVTPTIHLQNGNAVARTMHVDYIFVAQER